MTARNERGQFRPGPGTTGSADIDVLQYGIWLASGLSVGELADRLAISRTSVYHQLKQAGLPTPAVLHGTLAARLRTRTRPHGDCLLWTGGTTPQGYPCVSVAGVKQSVSHLLLTRSGHHLPHRAVVTTRCRDIRCVAVVHLQVVTASDIPLLTALAGRTPIGERHWNARLSWDEVDDIRADPAPANELAERHQVSPATISAIRGDRRWNNAAGRNAPTHPATYPATHRPGGPAGPTSPSIRPHPSHLDQRRKDEYPTGIPAATKPDIV